MTAESAEAMTGGEALARMLQAHGAGPIFMPGGLTGDALDAAIARLALAYAPIVDPRAAAFAADAYAEASGRVGLLSLPAGMDVTEAAGGLLGAREAGSPVIAILPAPTVFETSLLAGACKEILRAEPVSAIPAMVRRAFIAATTGRPGPIALIVPADVRVAEARFDPGDLVEHGRFESASALRARPDLEALHDAVERLAKAERPLVVAGPDVHVSRAAKALQDLAETWRIPVAHSPGGKGAIACASDLSAGLVAPGAEAAALLAEADLVFAIGGALDEIAAADPALVPASAPLVELEARAEAIGRVRAVTVPLWGDPRAGVEALAFLLEQSGARTPDARVAWAESVVARRKAERETAAARVGAAALGRERIVAILSDYLPPEGLLVVDPGPEAEAAYRGFEVKRCGRGLIAARAASAEGSAFPAAIGAALAAPGRIVVALASERGAARALGVLESARRLGLPINLLVVNEGAARAAAEPADGAPPADLAETRFDRAAQGLGCLGLRAETADEVASALEEALSFRDGPALLDVKIG